jgi:hypothetical protein
MTSDPTRSEIMSDRAVGDHEISIDELDKASGGFNVGAAVMQAYRAAAAKELARNEGCLGPASGGFGGTTISEITVKATVK